MRTKSGKDYLRREFQKLLPNLLQVQDEKVHTEIAIRRRECGLTSVINNRFAFRCDVIKILDYVTFLFEKGYEYRTIQSHRSTISAFHHYEDGKPVHQHPEVCALVNGIFNIRAPQPRYMFV